MSTPDAATPDASGGPDAAALFAALGDPTRLALVAALAGGGASSLSGLTRQTPLTRQAVAKHLRALESVGLVRRVRAGRETRVALDPAPLRAAQAYLDAVSAQWDDALSRFRDFVEED